MKSNIIKSLKTFLLNKFPSLKGGGKVFEVEIRDQTQGKEISCARCGGCCKKIAPHIEDILRIEEKYPLAEFLESDQNDLFLKEIDGHCLFLTEDKLCSIYPIRPDVCRLFPARVEVIYINENEIICDLKLYSHWEGESEYPRCPGGLIGKAHFQSKENDFLPTATSYTQAFLRECAANSVIEKETKQKIVMAKSLEEVNPLMLDYLSRLKEIYQGIDLNEAIKILKENFNELWRQKNLPMAYQD